MYLRVLSILLICSFLACKNEPADNTDQGTEDTSLTTPGQEGVLMVTLECIPSEDKETEPKSKINVLVNNIRHHLTNVIDCNTILNVNYENYQIPAKALSAVGGWWAGGGDYFYLHVGPQGGYQIFQGSIDEESPSNDYGYKVIMSINEDGSMQPSFSMADIEGIFTAGGHDQSWMLATYTDAGNIKAILYEIDGMIPPASDIKMALSNAKKTILKQFDISAYYRTFTSELGHGEINGDAGNYQVTFFEIEDLIGEPLTLTYNQELSSSNIR